MLEDFKGFDRQNPIQRSEGITATERYLNQLCQHSFLSLWSYSGVYRDQGRSKSLGDGKEVCDLLVVFENHILIFSDKDCVFRDTGNLDIDWQRWFRSAVRDSAKQIWGAERWIRDFPNLLFLDRACTQIFPIDLPDLLTVKFHRILVAHGVSEACRKHLGGSGGLIIMPFIIDSMHIVSRESGGRPFTIGQINTTKGYIHVFDDSSLSIIMQTLDTITDFVTYLTKKEQLIQSGQLALARSEEDLLAYYLQHYNKHGEHDFSVSEGHSELTVGQGLWDKFANSSERQAQIAVDSESYAWDQLIESFNHHILDGDYFYYSNDPSGIIHAEKIMAEPILRFLAHEPRLVRRELGRLLLEIVKMTPPSKLQYRFVHPRSLNSPCYVFVVVSHRLGEQQITRDTWAEFLRSYSLSAKHICPQAQHIIAIGVSKNVETGEYNAKNVAYIDARGWSKKEQGFIQQLMYKTSLLQNLRTFGVFDLEYPTKTFDQPERVPLKESVLIMKGRDRNKPCLCGSGKKYKNCCGGW